MWRLMQDDSWLDFVICSLIGNSDVTPKTTASDWIMKHSRMWIPDEGQSTKNNREIINSLYQLWLEFFSHGAVLWRIGMRGRYGSCHHLTEQVREAKILPTMTKDTRRLQTHKYIHTHTAIPKLQQKRKQLFRLRAHDMTTWRYCVWLRVWNRIPLTSRAIKE